MTLTDTFNDLYQQSEADPKLISKIVELIEKAPAGSERDGLRALMYHDGIGYPVDLDKSFELAEKAAREADPLGLLILAFMCDNAETPDQAYGGPRQKYDHYDAERFYTKCAEIESRWRHYALSWLVDYFDDSARGGDPDIAAEYLTLLRAVSSEEKSEK